jgi:pimeloyl-ACP methyl ester carboxylesterase
MSAITIENDLVHYEVLGRGRPVILLHGWLGSWRYWIPAMQQLSMKYRTYAVDFWGFGDSGRDTRRYDFASQVQLLDQFMEKMGIAKAALVGHDLGAAVAAYYAAKHPDRVPRLMVVCPPLFWMAPKATLLTANPPPKPLPAPAISAPAPTTPATPTAPAATPAAGSPAPAAPTVSPAPDAAVPAANSAPSAPAAPAVVPPATVTPPAASTTPATPPAEAASTASAGKMPVNPDADTLPWRTDEMRTKLRAAAEKLGSELASSPVAKSPRDAATPPTDQPAKEIGPGAPGAGSPTPALPEQLSVLPAMPKLDYVAEPLSGTAQRSNPLKDHLGTLDRIELLKRHVEAGPDQEKLRAEVEKADTVALAMSVESFADVDTLRDLRTLSAAAVAVYGVSDTFIPVPDARMLTSLTEGRSTFHVIKMESTRHFPMLEDIAGFSRLLVDFLEIPDVTKLTIKQTWERRVR